MRVLFLYALFREFRHAVRLFIEQQNVFGRNAHFCCLRFICPSGDTGAQIPRPAHAVNTISPINNNLKAFFFFSTGCTCIPDACKQYLLRAATQVLQLPGIRLQAKPFFSICHKLE